MSVLVALVATRWAMSMRGFPGRPTRWPLVFLRRVWATLRRPSRETVYWVGLGVYSTVVAGLHFEGLALDIYTTIAWWDLLTHTLSGIGVGALLYLTLDETDTRPPYWIVPSVLAFGAGFEVYEYVFKDFWYTWPVQFYVWDTVTDLVVGAAGGALVVVFVAAYRAWRTPTAESSTDPDGPADAVGRPNSHRTDGSGAHER